MYDSRTVAEESTLLQGFYFLESQFNPDVWILKMLDILNFIINKLNFGYCINKVI